MNKDGGGFLQGVVITKCGAELLMAALDQFHARFESERPGTRRKTRDRARNTPPRQDVDRRRREGFLANVLKTESEEAQAKSLRFDELDNERKTYCIVRLMEEGPDHDYMA